MAYFLKPSAVRDLKKLPTVIQRRIIQKLDFFVASKNPLHFAWHLRDRKFGEYRFRIGDYRVIFDVESKSRSLIILAIGHRRDIYK